MFDLLIDLGGTKIRMTLAKDQEIDWQLVKDIPADQHDCLESAIMAYLNEIDFAENLRINGVSVGIAGPVTIQTGKLPTLDGLSMQTHCAMTFQSLTLIK